MCIFVYFHLTCMYVWVCVIYAVVGVCCSFTHRQRQLMMICTQFTHNLQCSVYYVVHIHNVLYYTTHIYASHGQCCTPDSAKLHIDTHPVLHLFTDTCVYCMSGVVTLCVTHYFLCHGLYLRQINEALHLM